MPYSKHTCFFAYLTHFIPLPHQETCSNSKIFMLRDKSKSIFYDCYHPGSTNSASGNSPNHVLKFFLDLDEILSLPPKKSNLLWKIYGICYWVRFLKNFWCGSTSNNIFQSLQSLRKKSSYWKINLKDWCTNMQTHNMCYV